MSCRNIPLFIIVLKVSLDGVAAIPSTTTSPPPAIAEISGTTKGAVVDNVGIKQTRELSDASKTLQNDCRFKSCSQLITEEQLGADSLKTDVIVHIEAAAKSNQAGQLSLAQVLEVPTLDNTNTHQKRFSDLPGSTLESSNTPVNYIGTQGVVATDSGTRISVHTAINITKSDESRTNTLDRPNFITQSSYGPGYPSGIPVVPQNFHHPLPHQHFQRSGHDGNLSPFIPLQEGPAYSDGIGVVPYYPYQPYPDYHKASGFAPYVPHQRPEYTQDNTPRFRQETYHLGNNGQNAGPGSYSPHPGFTSTLQQESDELPIPERHRNYGNIDYGHRSYPTPPHMPPTWVAHNKYNPGANENTNPSIQGYGTQAAYDSNQDVVFPNRCCSTYSNRPEGNEGMLYLPSAYSDSRGVASDPHGIQLRIPLDNGRMNVYPNPNISPHLGPAVAAMEKNRIGNQEYNTNVYNLRRIPYFEPSYQNQHRGENPPPQVSWFPRGYVNNPVEFKDIPQIRGGPSLLLSKLSDNCNSSTVLCKCEEPQNCNRSRRRTDGGQYLKLSHNFSSFK